MKCLSFAVLRSIEGFPQIFRFRIEEQDLIVDVKYKFVFCFFVVEMKEFRLSFGFVEFLSYFKRYSR